MITEIIFFIIPAVMITIYYGVKCAIIVEEYKEKKRRDCVKELDFESGITF